MAVADRVVPMATEVKHEIIMRLRITHNPGAISSVIAPTSVSVNEFSLKEDFYAQLQMVMVSCP